MAGVGSRMVPWLAPVLTAGLTVAAAATAHAAESGSRAGAEPLAAAIVIGSPFAILTLVNVACALGLGIPWARAAHVGVLGLQTIASAGVCLVVVVLDGTPGPATDVVVALVVLGPVALNWVWSASHLPSEV